MSDTLILASDIGTSSVKTALFRCDGSVVAAASRSHVTTYQQPGWASQQADDWWFGFVATVRTLLEQQPEAHNQIAVIGISGQMLGCLPVDAAGAPLTPSPIHADTRARAECAHIQRAIGAERLYHLTGNILDARSGLCKMLWLKEHEPDVYRQTSRFLQAKDYVRARLTGNCDATDFSDAAHAQWIDIRRRVVLSDVLLELGLDSSKIPTVCAGTALAGCLGAEPARLLGLPSGIPVVTGAGDGACAGIGAGAVLPGDVYGCLGTTAWITRTTEQPVFDRARRLFNLVSVDGRHYGVYGATQTAGQAVNWALDLFGTPDARSLDQAAASVMPGSDGLIFLPYLDGERAPIYDEQARGVFFGLHASHRQAHLQRAVLEGVALALRSIVTVMREHAPMPALRLIGGGARSDLWRSIIAGACDLVLHRPAAPSADATALGMALSAAVGVGLLPDLSAARSIVAIQDSQTPDPALTRVYDRLYPLFTALYAANKPLFGELAALRAV